MRSKARVRPQPGQFTFKNRLLGHTTAPPSKKRIGSNHITNGDKTTAH